jgi:hypothetical protein
MPDSNVTEESGFAIVCALDQHCVMCHGGPLVGDDGGPIVGPLVRIISIQRKNETLVSTGIIPMGAHCANCGAAVSAISKVVPIELEGLTCTCGHNKFRFAIRSLKPNKVKDPTEWNFDLDIICIACTRRKFTQKVLSFFRLKRVKVGAAGVDLEMFPERKS